MLDKHRAVRAMLGDRPVHVQCDGGVDPTTAGACRAAGADVLVAGSAVFGKGSLDDPDGYASAMEAIREAAG